MHRFAEAEAELIAANQVLTRVFGAKHPRTLEVVERLSALYEAWDMPGKASGYR